MSEQVSCDYVIETYIYLGRLQTYSASVLRRYIRNWV
jgi:hypothetical protein